MQLLAVFLVCCAVLPVYAGDAAQRPELAYSPVKLIHPRSDWDVTDTAVSFRWERQCNYSSDRSSRWTTYQYRIQVAGDPSFSAPVIDELCVPPRKVEDVPEAIYDYWKEVVFMPRQTLSPGIWYWRVRVTDGEGGPWSEVGEFRVNNNHTMTAPGRSISPENPLFIFDMYMGGGLYQTITEQWPTYWSFFPDDVKPYVALAVSREHIGATPGLGGLSGNFIEHMKPLQEHKIPTFFKTGGPDKDSQLNVDLTEMEYLFKNHANVLGITTGENFWDFLGANHNPDTRERELLWLKRVMMLCAKYGKYMIFGEGNWATFNWDRYLGQEVVGGEVTYEWMSPDFIREHKDYVVLCPKNNHIWGYHQCDSAVFGAWLTDMSTHMGTWAEAWYWGDAGYNDVFSPQTRYGEGNLRKMPPNMWTQMHLLGLCKGATVFNFGGESSVTEWGEYDAASDTFGSEENGEYYTAVWDMHGHKTPVLDRYVIPFIRAVVKQKLIPTRSEVLKEIKIAVDPGPVEADKGNAVDYGHYASLYRGTYGIREYVSVEAAFPNEAEGDKYNDLVVTGCRYEIIPNAGRYYFVPVLPHPARDIDTAEIKKVKLPELQDIGQVQKLFDKTYPQRYHGDAWVTLVGDKVFIMNSHENSNVTETYSIPLEKGGGISSITGHIGPHAYVMGKRGVKDNRFWFQANVNQKGPYTDGRTTEIAFTCRRQPQMTVTPEGVLIDTDWDAAKKVFSIRLNHNAGAAEAEVIVDD